MSNQLEAFSDDKIPPAEKISTPNKPKDLNAIKGFEWWRRTMQYKTGLGLDEKEKLRYENDLAYRKQDIGCQKCYEYRDWVLKYSPTVRFMMESIEKVNKIQNGYQATDDSLDNNGQFKFDTSKIICEICPEWKSGGFNPQLGILLCQNRLRSKSHLEDTLAHELVHYFDNLKWNVNWLDLKHHACSEIRASSLSGECRFMEEFFRRGLGVTLARGHQECVKRRAILSVMGNPKCADKKEAERAVNQVWDSCFNDTRPFEEIYR
ncbi:hypothetical protein TBLA_0F04010 [Henningerozyma blattae CBS 6284]|uniref:Mitochondrial inner membrane protease ATP23 n=1 Tax=Henningerozyma blattae (strain ATCC 34711 / CBS 6284 / DSM 70876 / NBRC 10599 / NRRL Y-10934 / UCD 77-7) TaxID=1071380 RepID=I2H6D2_HENB6|nr:hypothetical protein TBLA_0F04010 [Tetrapisispora blattae CBS 6284]CCH61934.1 hypothetical protein TBLA_0F04010 [Tetrapisispora blattae CBS 6284]